MAKKKTHEEFIKELQDINSDIQCLEKYMGTETKIKFKCNLDGHEWYTKPSHILSKHGCPKCSSKKTSNRITKSYEDFTKRLNEINENIECVGVFKNLSVKSKFKCKIDGHIWEAFPSNLVNRKSGCPRCSKNITISHDEFIQKLNKVNPNIECLNEFLNINTILKFKCKIDGHVWNAKPNNIINNNTGCPKCCESHGERDTERFLNKVGLSYKAQYKIDECKNQRHLPFDFAILKANKLCALIEYQGKQHYKPIKHFGGTKQFEKTIKNDEIKREYCKSNNIPLIEIPYYIKDIEPYLLKQFNKLEI